MPSYNVDHFTTTESKRVFTSMLAVNGETMPNSSSHKIQFKSNIEREIVYAIQIIRDTFFLHFSDPFPPLEIFLNNCPKAIGF